MRSIISGWEAALKVDLSLDWDQVSEVLGDVLVHDDQSEFPAEGGRFDDDVDFRQAKQAAVSLLGELVRRRDTPVIPVGPLAKFAGLVLNQASDETAWTEYDRETADSDTDALTLSINLQWPIRVRGLMNSMTLGKDTPWYGRAAAVLKILSLPESTSAGRLAP